MPFGVKVECLECEAEVAAIWQRVEGGVICNACYERRKENEKVQRAQKVKEEEAQVKAELSEIPKPSKIVLRKSTRMTRNYKTRANPYALPKPAIARGRGRRGLLRRAPVRLPSEGRSWLKANRVYVRNGYLRVGDIVNMVGSDGEVYYAQLRGFLADIFGEKRAVVTWLVPTEDYVPGKFNPNHFYLGPDEDTPRRLTSMEFECRLSGSNVSFGRPSLFHESVDNFVLEPISVA